MEADRQVEALERFVAEGRGPRYYGEQYGDPDTDPLLRSVRDSWLYPMLNSEYTILEIGSGGGRWSHYCRGRVKQAILVDGTRASEEAIRQFCPWNRFRYLVSPDGLLPDVASGTVDYVWSYDTFVHFHPPLFNTYVGEIGRVLRQSGVLHLHYAVRWGDCRETNDQCFQYRNPDEVEHVLSSFGLQVTGRKVEIHEGYGSILIESFKA